MSRTVAARLLSAIAAPLVLVALAATAAPAATLNVPSSAYPTIQAAINAAATGDSVVVSPGTYLENIDFKGKAILVTSDVANGGNASNTIIDGGGGALPTVQFITSESRSSILQGFTIRNGGGTQTGGPDSTYGDAGGVFIYHAAPILSSNTITQNICYGVHSIASAPLLLRNTISNTNWAAGAPCTIFSGSGVWMYSGGAGLNGGYTAAVIGNTVQNNTRSGLGTSFNPGVPDGGAALALIGLLAPVIQGNTLENNTTAGAGGGLLVTNSDSVVAFDNLIVGNQAQSGAGIYVQVPGSSTGIPDGILSDNTLVNNVNVAPGASAGTAPDAQIVINDGVARFVVADNVISGASSTTAAISCGTTQNGTAPTPPVIEYNDTYSSGGAPSVAGDPRCVAQAGAFGNIATAPQFSNAAGGDYHLLAASPAVDHGNTSILADLLPLTTAAGFPGLPPDLDSNPRVVDATGLGYPVLDIGTYELAGSQDATINALYLTATNYEIAGGQTASLNASLFTSANSGSGTVTLTQTNPDATTATYAQPLVTTPPSPTNPGGSIAATYTTNPLNPGLYTFVATYPAPAGGSPGTSVHAYILVDPYATSLSLACSPNPSTFGQPVNLTIALTSTNGGVPPGDLTLLLDGTPASTIQPAANGTASYSITNPPLAVGQHTIQVTYAGTGSYSAAQSTTCTETVTAAVGATTATTLTPANQTAALGQTVSFSVHVANTASGGTAVPTGTVQLYDGGSAIGAPQTLDTSGNAILTYSSFTAGTHAAVTAIYTPASGAAFTTSTSNPVTVVITGQAPTITLTATPPNSALALSPVLLTATVLPGPNTNGAPTGTVNFFDGNNVLGTAPLTNGVATLTYSQFTASPQGTPQTHALHAVYSGDTNFATSTSGTYNEVINPNPTATALFAPATSTAFAPVTLAAHTTSGTTTTPIFTPVCNPLPCVAPTVTFFSNGQALGSSPLDATGGATLTINPGAGTYTITAVFSGDGYFAPSTSPGTTLTVSPLASALSLTATPPTIVVRQAVQLTAALSAAGVPASALSGTVTFSDGGALLGTAPLTNGVATLSFAPTTPGAHLLLAHFGGNGSLLPADATFTLNVTPQDFTITPASPTVTIKIEHHTTTQVRVDTLGGLVDSIHLSCDNLPAYLTCDFRPADIAVNQVGPPADTTSSTVSLYLDTDFVLGYARLHQPAAPTSHTRGLAPIALALLCPAALFFGLRRRMKLPGLLLVTILSAGLFSASGCSGLYPPHTPPGTYPLTLTGHAQGSNITRTATLTLVVTQ